MKKENATKLSIKISIITASYNNEATIASTLKSVGEQTFANIEHIIVDGVSKDKTLEIAHKFPHITKIVSEKDKGLYDALNKGIKLSTGDIIGILHADDRLYDSTVIEKIVNEFERDPKLEISYGDIVFINNDKEEKTTRYYSSKNFKLNDFSYGKMPAHPAIFMKKELYHNDGFNLQYSISSDFEFVMRKMLIEKRNSKYSGIITHKMLSGGKSTKNFKSNLTINSEILNICQSHNISTNYLKIYSKYFKKIFQLNPFNY